MGLTKPRAAQIFNLDYKQSTRVVTTTNITLSGGAPNSVDGINLSLNDRVLVTGQTTGSQNGLYLVTTLGSGSNGTWARTSDGNENGEIEAGMIVMVTEGTVYADTQWKLITDDPITINTTALTFTQNYSANSISSGSSNVVVNSNASVTISSAGTANVATFNATAITATANINPSANVTYSLGNTTNRWQDLWLSNSTIYLGNINLSATATSLTVDGSPVLTGGAGGDTLSVTGNVTGGNLLTSGLISATGNITGNYILGNGSQLTGLPATYSNANVTAFLAEYGSNTISSTGTITAGNITGGNILTGGLISATGNITGNYILGNGVSLTGVITSVANINNGTSNVTVVSPGGNVTVGINGSGNIAEFSTSGLSVIGNVNTDANLSVAGTVTAASTVGGVITGTSVSVTGTVTASSTVGGIITGTSASVSGNVTGGNLLTGGLISTAANISGGNLLINGDAVITGNLNVQGTETIFNVANLTVNDKDIIVANNVTGGTNVDGAGIQAGNPGVATWFFNNDTTSWQSNIAITPTANGTLSLGGASNYWGTAFVTSASITGNVTSGNLTTAGMVSATGNITGGNILGNGAGLSGINAFSNVAVTGGNSAVANSISDTLTLTAGSGISLIMNATTDTLTIAATGSGESIFSTGGQMGVVHETVVNSEDLGLVTEAVTDEYSLATLFLDGFVGNPNFLPNSINGNILVADAVISTTGNITGAYFFGNGSALTGVVAGAPNAIVNGTTNISTTTNGNANITIGGTSNVVVFSTTGVAVSGTTITTGNVAGGNLVTAGQVTATGNITGNFIFGNGSQLTGIDATGIQNGTSNVRVVSSDGNVATGIGGTSNVVVVATTGQFVTGLISATGNISGGNLNVTGNIVDTGALSILTGSNGNITVSPNGTGVVIMTANTIPSANATYDLGSTTARWRTVFTSDLDLNNGIGDWTIVEGEDDLFLYNNKKGKVFKFALIEVDPTTATPKIDRLK
jgi:hypothetical protein